MCVCLVSSSDMMEFFKTDVSIYTCIFGIMRDTHTHTHTQINPPHYIPLVEVVPAPWTSDSVVTATVAIMRGLGQSPITAKKEVNGFIFNRLQYALIMEAWRLVEVCVCVFFVCMLSAESAQYFFFTTLVTHNSNYRVF